MTRKRMRKLLMSLGLSRNGADMFSRASKQINAMRHFHPEAVPYESRLFEQRLEQYMVLRDILRNANKTEEYRRYLWNAYRFGIYSESDNLHHPGIKLDICNPKLEGKNPNIVLLDDSEHMYHHHLGFYGMSVNENRGGLLHDI